MLIGNILVLFVATIHAESIWYTIWPKDLAAKDVNQKITDYLESKSGKDDLYVSKSGLGNHYWYALLPKGDKDQYDKLDGVRYVAELDSNAKATFFSPIVKNEHTLHRRDALEPQKGASDHLKIISQAEGQELEDVDGYYYDKSAGESISIYVVDSGFYKHPKEFPNTQVSWLFAGPFPDKTEKDVFPIEKEGHGTCMASVALGKEDGVSKRAALKVVKADTFTNTDKVPDASSLGSERFIDALALTYDDIMKNNLKGKAVVSMSIGTDRPEKDDYDACVRDAYAALVSGLLKLDVPVAVAAGSNRGPPPDDKPEETIRTYPALLGETEIKDLTVVGSVDEEGAWELGSRHADYCIAAPGEPAGCASSVGDGYHSTDGTSPATAEVAGLLAYYMALGKSGADARKQLFEKAYSRAPSGPKVIWNLVDTRNAGSSGASAPSAADDALKCRGVGGDLWIIHKDQAVEAAKQFCGQDVSPKGYYQGSVDDLELSLKNLKDDKKPLKEAPNCVETFTTRIIDGCDGNNPENNPHNYKFGGTFTTPDGWEFALTPKAQKVNENSCDVSYKFALDAFEVRGKNFPDAKLGANGEGFKKEIDGCGAVTKWKFEWTPNDVKYQWYASGQLPIGTKSCVGRATQSAGGTSAGNCKGSG